MIFFLYALYAQHNKARKLLFSPKQTLIVAHRGLRSAELENTLEAFQAAFIHGVDGVEFDVQMTSDLVPMVFHDHNLKRLLGVEHTIDQLSFLELSKLRQSSEQYEKHYRIPSLHEVLLVMPENKLINIELKETTRIKGSRSIKAVLDVIAPFKEKLKIVISSFDPKILQLVSRCDDSYALGLLLDEKLTLGGFLQARSLLKRVDYLHPHIKLLSPALSKKIKRFGVPLIVWGHKKIGEEATVVDDCHAALISDCCLDLLACYRR